MQSEENPVSQNSIEMFYGSFHQEPKLKSNDEIIEEIYDDLGKGPYQYYALIFAICLNCNCSFLMNNIAYFESLPTYY